MTIKVEQISKVYSKDNKDVVVLDRISLTVPSGDFLAIVGPSGSGKSTLLLILGGMLSPSQGEVSVDNSSLYAMNLKERALLRQKKIGFVFQTFHLIPYLTALQNVQLPLMLSVHTEKEQQEKASALLERVGLKERMFHKPSELSVGQQQRVALARMLANEPQIILADEPTGNLDPKTAENMVNFLQELNQEKRTIILVTHDEKLAKSAKRIYALAP
jgi:putative ABC transport system ATP-binding protein